AKRTGAAVVWIPRRAGERGAVEAGALPTLLPGGGSVNSSAARAELAKLWEVAELPRTPGRDAASIISAAATKALGALVVGGVTPSDVTSDMRAAMKAAPFVLSLEVRRTEVADYADVVLPVAPPSEK